MSLKGQIGSLIAYVGEKMQLSRDSGGAYNPATREVEGESAIEVDVIGCFQRISNDLVDGELVKMSDRRLKVRTEDLTLVPEEGDTVTRGTEVYRVLGVGAAEWDGQAMSYDLHVRGFGPETATT